MRTCWCRCCCKLDVLESRWHFQKWAFTNLSWYYLWWWFAKKTAMLTVIYPATFRTIPKSFALHYEIISKAWNFKSDAPGSAILVVYSRAYRLEAGIHLVLHSTWSTWTLDSCHLIMAHGSGSRPGWPSPSLFTCCRRTGSFFVWL